MKKIIVFGATGQTGIELIKEGLERGHFMTAFVRNTDKIKIKHINLKIIQGDLKNLELLESVLINQECIVLALGVRLGEKELICSETTKLILPLMEKLNIKRLISIGGTASENEIKNLNLSLRMAFFIMKKLDANAFLDKKLQDELLAKSNLNWTSIRAPWLTLGLKTQTYKHGLNLPLRVYKKISRADLAHFIIYCLENDLYHQEKPIIYL
jgi:putative NADH-flavin reductase